MSSLTLLILAPIAFPALAGIGHALLGRRAVATWFSAVAAAGLLGSAIVLATFAVDRPRTALAGTLRVDALSAFMLIVIGAVALLAMAASPAYLAGERAAGHLDATGVRRYGMLTQGFVAAMALAVTASSLGVLWVAVEATTIFTAFLVGHARTRAATEAAWKYVVICSAGIALAFLGIILLHFAARHADIASGGAMDWATVAAGAADLDPGVTRIAIALLVLGFGTKAGLVPLHAWLPDAHSQAPAPVSALMSGVLLSVAFYAILRIKVISDAALGSGFMRLLLVTVALVSLALAAALLLAQRDFKRMLAYSSIEHMGLLALGAAIGSRLALAGVLLHVLGHGLAKSVAFVSSGHIQQLAGDSRISSVRHLFARSPLLAAAFGASLLALLGFPPFSLFVSELAIFRAGFASGMGWAVAVALVLLLVAMAAIGTHAVRMLFGQEEQEEPGKPEEPVAAEKLVASMAAVSASGGSIRTRPRETRPRETRRAESEVAVARPAVSTVLVLLTGLAVAALLGLWAWPLDLLLEPAAAMIGGTR